MVLKNSDEDLLAHFVKINLSVSKLAQMFLCVNSVFRN